MSREMLQSTLDRDSRRTLASWSYYSCPVCSKRLTQQRGETENDFQERIWAHESEHKLVAMLPERPL